MYIILHGFSMANKKGTRHSSEYPVNCVSWNVKSLNSPLKFWKIITHLKQLNKDIAFLQETHVCSEDSLRISKKWSGQVFQSNFHSRSHMSNSRTEGQIRLTFQFRFTIYSSFCRFFDIFDAFSGRLCAFFNSFSEVFGAFYDVFVTFSDNFDTLFQPFSNFFGTFFNVFVTG